MRDSVWFNNYNRTRGAQKQFELLTLGRRFGYGSIFVMATHSLNVTPVFYFIGRQNHGLPRATQIPGFGTDWSTIIIVISLS